MCYGWLLIRSNLSRILDIHLQDNAVMQSSFTTLEVKLERLVSGVSSTKKIADQAKSVADKAIKGKRRNDGRMGFMG